MLQSLIPMQGCISMELLKLLNPLGLKMETEALQRKQTRSCHRLVMYGEIW
jgi:hypothetical protein